MADVADKWLTGHCQCTHMALAFVVPCQAGVSVLRQPHEHGVADVLPAVQKVAEMQRKNGERERGCEVLYDGGKCTSLPL